MGLRTHLIVVVLLLGWSAATAPAVAADPSPGWPTWRGPFANGSGVDCGEPLVDDLGKAVELWSCPLPETRHIGHADLAVAGGRVYAYLFRPGGELVHADTLARGRPGSQNGLASADDLVGAQALARAGAGGSFEERRRQALVLADDVILCLDAATGRLLWQRVYRAKGANHRLITSYSPQCTPCVSDGRVYVLGSMGRLYCLDAATGRPIWESDVGPQKRLVERNLRQGDPRFEFTATGGHQEQFVSCPVVADGVLVCNNHDTLCSGCTYPGLSGFDARTGRPLWDVPGIMWHYSTPIRWAHGGKAYALCASGGRTSCVEPRTGRLLWSVGAGSGRQSTLAPAVAGDLMVSGSACYRISPEKAELRRRLSRDVGKWPVIYKQWVFTTEDESSGMACFSLDDGLLLATGEPENWKAARNWCVPVAGDGRVFAASHGSGLTMYRASGADTRRLPGRLRSATYIAPVYVAGRLYAKGDTDIRCYDVRAQAAKPATPAPIAVGADSPFLTGREWAVADLVKAHEDGDKTAIGTLRAWLGSDDWPRMEAAACVMASNSVLAATALEDMESACLRLTRMGRWAEAAELLDVVSGIRQEIAERLALKLAPLLGGAETDAVFSACQLVVALGASGRVHAPRLLALFKQGDADASWAAARALDAVGVPEDLAADTLAAIVPVLGEGAYARQWGGLQVLQRLGPQAAPAIDRVKDIARRHDDCLAIMAWDVLVAVGERAVPALAELLLAVKGRDFRVSNRLSGLRADDLTALTAEIERLSKDEVELRKTVEPVLGAIRTTKARVRASDIRAMLKTAPSELPAADLLLALHDPDSELRDAAGEAAARLGAAILPELVKALHSTNPAVVLSVAQAIGRVNAPVDAAAVPGLIAALGTEVEATRGECNQRAAAHPDRAAEMRAERLRRCVRASSVIPALALAGEPGVKATADLAKDGDEVVRAYAVEIERLVAEKAGR